MGFKVGDIVRIREWDDMVEEFGKTADHIDCRYAFTEPMRPLCGKEFTILRIEGAKVFGSDFGRWTISTDMIEYALFHREEFNDDTSDIECYLSEFIKR